MNLFALLLSNFIGSLLHGNH